MDKPVETLVTWDDPAGTSNYYELQILNSQMEAESFYQFDQIDDPVIQQECDLDYAPSSFIFTDRSFDGKTITISLKLELGYSHSSPEQAYAVLRNISEEYYHFKKSWHKHIYLQNSSIHWDGSFDFINMYSILIQGDPVPLYTNIENGIGIFAGYNQDIRKFRFID